MRQFHNFVCIDWSGEAVAKPKGLAVALARSGHDPPALLKPGEGWSRDSILSWMLDQQRAEADVLIALDLSPALPFIDRGVYFPGWSESPADAKALWRLIDREAANSANLSVTGALAHSEIFRHFRHHGQCGDQFPGGGGRFRVCEAGQRAMGLSPYSCFNLVGAAQVGKSSLTGMRVLNRLEGAIPVWPFDPIPTKGPLIIEIYTSLAARAAGIRRGRSKMRDGAALDEALAEVGSQPHAPLSRYTDHATDAILTAAWLRHVAGRAELWSPTGLTAQVARTEGWTFGVV